jgi:N-acetylmuramoyl-L-alanine amidase
VLRYLIYKPVLRRNTAAMVWFAKYTSLKWALALCAGLLGAPACAQDSDLSALARLDGGASRIVSARVAGTDGLAITLALSQPVPWRVRVLDDPARLIMDFREVNWAALADMPVDTDAVLGLRAGVFRPTWSRLVIELAGPMLVDRAEMVTQNGRARVDLRLRAAEQGAFAAAAALAEPAAWALPKPAEMSAPRIPLARRAGPMVVVLDPGHGGIDPGAQQGGMNEADLMLTFARELKEVLLRTGEIDVVMTREADIFVPLEARISTARAANADAFLSLHADALQEGGAQGATIYTLADEASDAAAAALAERHDRDDLLAGVDLTAQDDLVARVLMDMARLETTPRIARLANALEGAIKAQGIKMHRRPQQEAGFSVLKSPDIPSTLLELGFMSSPADLANLQDPAWRARMANAVKDALIAWAMAERAAPPPP